MSMGATSGEDTSEKSRVNAAYRQIKERILNNVYPPGFQSLEMDLARELGMSRTPVREALILLANEGLIEVIPRRGMRVVPLSQADMTEIYQVLTALETMAVELTARRLPSEEELAPMREALEDMDRALEADALEDWAEADERYHRSILELCNNERLATMAGTVMDQGRRARMITLRLRPKPWQSNIEHRAVYDAIRSGDSETARDVHHRHRLRASELITAVLSQYRLSTL